MCEHKNIVRIATGWFCPDCKRLFDNKPVAKAKEEKPKKECLRNVYKICKKG